MAAVHQQQQRIIDLTTSRERCSELEAEEWLLKPNPNRFVLFPIQHQDLWAMYQKHMRSTWETEDVDLEPDRKEWSLVLIDAERHWVKHVLAYFAASDGIVTENLATSFMADVQVPEARFFYGKQIQMENIHSHVYSLLIATYIPDADECRHLQRAIEEIPCVAAKAQWAMRYMDRSTAPFAMRLLAFAAVEGIFFSASFCAIYFLKMRHPSAMNGLTQSNEWISRDEGLHVEFALLLYRKLKYQLTESMAHQLFREAVDIELSFVRDSLPVAMIGMNADLMSQYVRFVADTHLTSIGYTALWNVTNPFDFMERLALTGKTNFFDRHVTEYTQVSSSSSSTSFLLHNDF